MRQGVTFHDPHNHAAPMRVVYDPEGDGVKCCLKTHGLCFQNFFFRTSSLSVISFLFLVVGCTSRQAVDGKKWYSQPTAYTQSAPILAIRYDAPSPHSSQDRENKLRDFQHDFTRIKNLGFHTVYFGYVPDEKQSQIKEIASQADLCIDFGYPQSVGEVSSASAVVYGSSAHTSEARMRRSNRQTTNHTHRKYRSLAVIDLQRIDSDPHYSSQAQLLAQYHRSLVAGKTNGIVVGPFRQTLESSTSLMKLDEPLNASDRTAMAGLVERVSIWGAHLYGLYSRPLQPTPPRETVDIRVFFRGRRQYLFFFNHQTKRYARERFVIDKTDFVHPPQRAVELSTTSKKILGDVVHSRDGVFTFSIELRPGDAVLYELF